MSDYTVLKRIVLGPDRPPTGKTVHRHGNEELPAAAILEIAQYDGDSGYYLFYRDTNGEEITDTYHDTVQGAMEQGNFEYGVQAGEWQDIDE